MKGFQIKIDGNWGHFKKPETNNNPLSHDFITKTALIGLIGAVLGKEREEMLPLFPQLSEDLLYGVRLLEPVKKVSWGFTSRTAVNPTAKGTPKYFEFLRNPSFVVAIALKESRSKEIFDSFLFSIKNQESAYTPVLGWHNCPANLYYNSEGDFSNLKEDTFEADCFVEKNKHKPISIPTDFRIGFEKIPTYQNDDFWNLPEYYKDVIYPDAGHTLEVKGSYYEYSRDNEKWWLI